MCIRDRSCRISPALKWLFKEASAFSSFCISSKYAYSLRACLLYTSDAADDLLCVDLGGRRIIKKKKKSKRDYVSVIDATTGDSVLHSITVHTYSLATTTPFLG